MADIVDLGLAFNGSSTNISPQGLTLHYGGPSPWSGAVDRSSPEMFMATADHNRCPTIVRAWHAYHLSKGWYGLAYNDTTCPHGVVFVGRGPGRRSGANGNNEGNRVSPAICYIAGDGDPLTEPAKQAFKACEERYGVPLTWPHQHWTSTSCPGDPTLAWINAGFPMSVAPPPPALQRNVKMVSATLTPDGRIVEFKARPEDGRIVHRWQQAPSSGPWSDWSLLTNGTTEIAAPGAFDSVEAITNVDGRLELWAWHSAYRAVFTSYQVEVGGTWSDWRPSDE